MNASQKVTKRGIVVVLLLAALAVVGAVAVEFGAIVRGGNATISELTWTAWAMQPGAFVFVLAPLLFAAGFLAGHLGWQSAVVYDAIRLRINLDAALRLASEAQASYQLAKATGNGQDPLTVMVSPEFVRALADVGALEKRNVT